MAMSIREPKNVLDPPYEQIACLAVEGAKDMLLNGANLAQVKAVAMAFIASSCARLGLHGQQLHERGMEVIEEVAVRIAHLRIAPPAPQPVYYSGGCSATTTSYAIR